MFFFFLMIRRPPRSTRTDTLFPSTPLFRSAIGRAGVVLDLMQENGVITQAQAAAADPEDVKLPPEAPQNSVRYFTDWALPQLDTLIDETSEPLEVWTTIDLRLQRSAPNSLKAIAQGGPQGALVYLDRDG